MRRQSQALGPRREIKHPDVSGCVSDGELDAASVRRVMVHSDVCPSCRGFLDGIRTQLRAHKELAATFSLSADGDNDPELLAVLDSERAEALRLQLLANRRQLARILYEMGRGYVLMGLSPTASRVVAREPVPIPDMSLRGQSLLDEVSRTEAGAHGSEWVRAKTLFEGGELGTPAENVAKGKRLLNEALLLRPRFHEARIYLGHAYHLCAERALARHEFARVLELATEPVIRAFALENLGTVLLEEGRRHDAIGCFRELVESGVLAQEPRFFTAYFNLALAHGLEAEFAACRTWLQRLREEFPHKQRMIRDELRRRGEFADVLQRHPVALAELTESFPVWFPIQREVC